MLRLSCARPRPALTGSLAAVAIALLLWPCLAHSRSAGAPLPQPGPGGTRGPSALIFSGDGKTLYVAEQDEGLVAALDADSGKTLAAVPSGGKEPTGLALSADGKTLAVANSFSGTLGLIDTEKRVLRATVPIPGGPWGVVITGGEAFVSVSELNQVAVVDLAAAKVTARIALGVKPRVASSHPGPSTDAKFIERVPLIGNPDERALIQRPTNLPYGARPRALALTPDGATLLCANMSGASLSVIDIANRREQVCVPLPCVNLRGVAVSPDGRMAYVTGQQPHNEIPTQRPERMWDNGVCFVLLAGEKSNFQLMLHLDGYVTQGAADPFGVVATTERGPMLLTLSGTHEVAFAPTYWEEVPLPLDAEHGYRRIPVGANPRALALRPGMRREVWVANFQGNTLSVLPLDSEATAGRGVDLDAPSKPDLRLRGRFLFTSAHLTRGGRFTCNTCHPDGNTDGLSWDFAHVRDGIGARNSRNLRGSVLLTSPYRWVPRENDFEEFVNNEIEGLLRTRRLPHSELHGFWEMANDLPLPPNPYRKPDGSFTPAALRGRGLYTGKAGCASCHGGEQYGGTGKSAWIGTTPKGLALDIPHLTGVYDSAPYLHDGRAVTLEAIFTRQNASHLHGKAHLLKPAEFADLIEFVREL